MAPTGGEDAEADTTTLADGADGRRGRRGGHDDTHRRPRRAEKTPRRTRRHSPKTPTGGEDAEADTTTLAEGADGRRGRRGARVASSRRPPYGRSPEGTSGSGRTNRQNSLTRLVPGSTRPFSPREARAATISSARSSSRLRVSPISAPTAIAVASRAPRARLPDTRSVPSSQPGAKRSRRHASSPARAQRPRGPTWASVASRTQPSARRAKRSRRHASSPN
jgi:hypothetical protein